MIMRIIINYFREQKKMSETERVVRQGPFPVKLRLLEVLRAANAKKSGC